VKSSSAQYSTLGRSALAMVHLLTSRTDIRREIAGPRQASGYGACRQVKRLEMQPEPQDHGCLAAIE